MVALGKTYPVDAGARLLVVVSDQCLASRVLVVHLVEGTPCVVRDYLAGSGIIICHGLPQSSGHRVVSAGLCQDVVIRNHVVPVLIVLLVQSPPIETDSIVLRGSLTAVLESLVVAVAPLCACGHDSSKEVVALGSHVQYGHAAHRLACAIYLVLIDIALVFVKDIVN